MLKLVRTRRSVYSHQGRILGELFLCIVATVLVNNLICYDYYLSPDEPYDR